MKKRIMDKVERALIDQIGVKPGDGIVVGVSGGADSVSLLKVIQDLSIKLELSVHAAHYNHGIRGESADRDSRFVAELCACLNVPLIIERGDVPAHAAGMAKRWSRLPASLGMAFWKRRARVLAPTTSPWPIIWTIRRRACLCIFLGEAD